MFIYRSNYCTWKSLEILEGKSTSHEYKEKSRGHAGVNYFIIQLYTKGENFCVFSCSSEASVEALSHILCVLKLLLCFGILIELCEDKINGKVYFKCHFGQTVLY